MAQLTVDDREFRYLLEQSGLEQKELAGLLGVGTVTVNRWCTDRSDHITPPWYAMNFLRAFLMLANGARDQLPKKYTAKAVKKAAA